MSALKLSLQFVQLVILQIIIVKQCFFFFRQFELAFLGTLVLRFCNTTMASTLVQAIELEIHLNDTLGWLLDVKPTTAIEYRP